MKLLGTVSSVHNLSLPSMALAVMNFIIIYRATKQKFKIFSKKTNPNQQILTESLNEMMNQEDLITLQAIITIKTLIKTFTFTMAQIFYI